MLERTDTEWAPWHLVEGDPSATRASGPRDDSRRDRARDARARLQGAATARDRALLNIRPCPLAGPPCSRSSRSSSCSAAAGCGDEDRPLPAVCAAGPAPAVRALGTAPGPVRLAGETKLSSCVERARSDADIQTVGTVLTRTADVPRRRDGPQRRRRAAARLPHRRGPQGRPAARTGFTRSSCAASSRPSGSTARRRPDAPLSTEASRRASDPDEAAPLPPSRRRAGRLPRGGNRTAAGAAALGRPDAQGVRARRSAT